jgi:bile acid-coenzyme A ligase
VYGIADPDLGQIVHAVIESSDALTVEKLAKFLAKHLARAKHPRSITLSCEPARDDAGKFRKPRSKESA